MDQGDERVDVGTRVAGFEDLVVWQKSMLLVRRVYAISRSFPSDEKFGLTSQIRRAAVSVPSNIAEGHERRTTADFVRFISDSEGSLAEVNTQLRIAVDLHYCQTEETADVFVLMVEIKRMLNALR